MALVVLVLAAGEGTRMKSKLPKVLHPVLGRPLLGHVLNSASALNPDALCVVTGAGRDQVEAYVASAYPNAICVEQSPRNGTGHAVRVAIDALLARAVPADEIMVLTGDTPLLTSETLDALLSQHRAADAAATVLTAELADPTGYGRVIRDHAGNVEGIVEHRDANDAERAVREINSGMYVFKAAPLRYALAQLTTANSQGEEYLTDVLAILRKAGEGVGAVTAKDADDISGVNDRVQLAAASAVMQQRINRAWQLAGVTIIDPSTTWIESDVVIAQDVTIHPNSHLSGRTAIASGASVGPDTSLKDTTVGSDAEVLKSHATGAHIGPHAHVGPFTFLRPGAELHENAKAGAYVEIKNAVIGSGSKVPHLSYVGDAEIGKNSNIGAATIFVNYDGENKHHTTVGNDVRIGSDTMLVAPVTVGDGAYTAAGSVITTDVPPGALGVGRAKQVNLLGWVLRKRPGSASAKSAEQAESAH